MKLLEPSSIICQQLVVLKEISIKDSLLAPVILSSFLTQQLVSATLFLFLPCLAWRLVPEPVYLIGLPVNKFRFALKRIQTLASLALARVWPRPPPDR